MTDVSPPGMCRSNLLLSLCRCVDLASLHTWHNLSPVKILHCWTNFNWWCSRFPRKREVHTDKLQSRHIGVDFFLFYACEIELQFLQQNLRFVMQLRNNRPQISSDMTPRTDPMDSVIHHFFSFLRWVPIRTDALIRVDSSSPVIYDLKLNVYRDHRGKIKLGRKQQRSLVYFGDCI